MTNLPDEYLKALGPELGAIYQKLCDDVSCLHFKWKQYRILFAESPERIDLLNGVAGTFFFLIQEVLHDDVLIHIARLTDRKDHGPELLSNVVDRPVMIRRLPWVGYHLSE